MYTKHKGFKLLAALLAVFTVLASCPLTALAEENTLLNARWFYDEGEGGEHGERISGQTFNTPVIITEEEGCEYAVIEFSDCVFNGDITVQTACDLEVFFCGHCEINGDIRAIGTDPDAPTNGRCVVRLHNVGSGICFTADNARLEANADEEEMSALENFEDFCWTVNGVELHAAMPGFSFFSDFYSYYDDKNNTDRRSDKLEVHFASEVIADNCDYNEYGIEIYDPILNEGEEAYSPSFILNKSDAGELSIYSWHNNNFENGVLPEGYTPGTVQVTGCADGAEITLLGSVDVSGLTLNEENGIFLIGTWSDENRIDLGGHSALIVGEPTDHRMEIAVGENGSLIDTAGCSNLCVSLNGKTVNVNGAHIFNNGSVYIPAADETVSYRLFAGEDEIPFNEEILPEDNKTHLNVAYEDVPEDIFLGDEKFCTSYKLDIAVGDAFVSIPVKHKSIVKAEPNGTMYKNSYFNEPITVFANCEEDFANVDFNDCTFAEGADITVIPGRTHIGVNFFGETQVEDTDGEPNLFEVRANDTRYSFSTNVFTNALPSGYALGEINCGRFSLNNPAPEGSYAAGGATFTFGGKTAARRGFSMGKECRCYHDYEAWDSYPPHDECGSEYLSRSLSVYGDITALTLSDTLAERVDIGCLYDDLTVDINGECGKNGFFSFSNVTSEFDLWELSEEETPYNTDAAAKLRGNLTAETAELEGLIDISELTTPAKLIYYPAGISPVLTAGSHTVSIPCARGDYKGFTLQAESGANITCAASLLPGMTVLAGGEELLPAGMTAEDDKIIIPGENEKTDYIVYAGEEEIFRGKGFYENGSTVLTIPTGKQADIYRVTAVLNGVRFTTDCSANNVLLAAEGTTYISGMTFGGELRLVTTGEKYNGEASRIVFTDCTFADDTHITLTADDDYVFVVFEGMNEVGGNCSMEIRSDDDELKWGINDTDINIENAPAGFTYLLNEVNCRVTGNSTGETYNIGDTRVTTGENENDWFNINYYTTWYDENDIGKMLQFNGNITRVENLQSADAQRPAFNEYCFDRMYSDAPEVYFNVENRSGEHGRIRIRTSSPNPDDPEDGYYWEMDGYSVNTTPVISGSIHGFDLETTGNADISALDFDYTENEIGIGLWNPVTSMNIGSHRVTLYGSSDRPVSITAAEGAGIRMNEQEQFLILNNDKNASLLINGIHIFGDNENYGVFIGKELSEEEIGNIRLFCGSDEPNAFSYEVITEDSKTHIYPTGEYDNNIGNWRLVYTLNGVTVDKQIYHKSWLCRHENVQTHRIEGMEYPTCGHGGYLVYECTDCENMWWEYTDALTEDGTHTPETVTGKEAACTEAGLSDGEICAVCGEVLSEQTEIPALGHDFAADAERNVKETCTEAGTEAYTCTVCDEQADILILPAGHKVSRLTGTPATCTADGKTDGAECSVCHAILIEQTKINATGHKTVILPAVPATCTADGKTEGSYCAVCGEVFSAQKTVEATGHQEATLTAIEPTCITEGRTEGKYCSVCNTILKMPQSIGLIDHMPVKDNAVPPTCTEKGLTEGEHCLVCETVLKKQQDVPAAEHKWDAGKVTKAATCKEAGIKTYTCTVCDETKTESIAKLTAHTYDAGKVTKAATCKEAGVKTYTCTVCGETKTESIAKLTAHTYKDGICTVCGTKDPNYAPSPAFVRGDADGDGKVLAGDARLALRGAVGLTGDKDANGIVINFNDHLSRAFLAGDADGDGKISASDARLILRASVGLEKFE